MDVNKNSSAMYLSASIFLEELMRISTDIVWKNTYLANRNEDPEYSIETELFMAAARGIVTFENIYQLEYSIMSEMGLSQSMMSICFDDKYKLPSNLRRTYTNLYIKKVLDKDPVTGHYLNYEEHNNYYRTLAGLPDIGDTDYVYNTRYDDIDKNTPIHLLPLSDRYNMERNGYLDVLIKRYPSKKYLKHIASKSIDIFTARIAERFSILYMKPSEYDNLSNDFRDVYNNARYNVTRVYYTEAFRKNNNLYDSFLALSILFMTVQLMHYKYLDVDITRDFYDLESIRYIYDSYNVPFFSDIPLQYHNKIVKNINRLISYKGSTRVFFDLFDLFDYGRMDVFEYYLLKSHKFDTNGVPVFVYKEDGSLDEKAVFDIKFGKVRLYDDPPLELSDVSNHVSYESITGLDPFWISDEALLNKIYGENFNYLETKYIGIQTVFDMMKIVYESSYFIQLIVSNRTQLSSTSMFYNNINSNINIFDMIIYLSALICEKYGYEGNISTELPSVSRILGFNFKDLASTLQRHIRNDPILSKDTELRGLIVDMNVNDINSVNNTFRKITRLRYHISDKIVSSANREIYFAYNNLEKIMMSTEIVERLYRKKNGEVADSFKDMLSDINPQLYIRLLTPDLDINHEIDTISVLFMNTFNELKYFESIDGMDIGIIIQHLFNILNFFKSAKAELTGYNITYIITSRGMNRFKLFSEIVQYSESNGVRKDRLKFLTDLMDIARTLTKQKEELLLIDKLSDPREVIRLEYDRIILDSMIKDILNILVLEYDDVLYYDVIVGIINRDIIHSKLKMGDSVSLLEEKVYYENNITKINEYFKFFDTLTNQLNIIKSPLKSKINKLMATINVVYEFMSLSDDIDMRKDVLKVLESITILESELKLDDLIKSVVNIIKLGIHTKVIPKDELNKIINSGQILTDDLQYLTDNIDKTNINHNMKKLITNLDDKVLISSESSMRISIIDLFTSFLERVNVRIHINQNMLMIDEINISGQNKQNNVVMGFNDKLLLLKEHLIN